MSKDDAAAGGYFLGAGNLSNVNRAIFSINQPDGDKIISNSQLVPDTWYHLVGVKNSTNLILYIDGESDNIITNTNPLTEYTGPLRIGAGEFFGPIFNFNGTIDNVRIYNRSLSAEQIHQMYLDTKDGYSNSNTITSGETNGGETWTCQVTPNDAQLDGLTKETSINVSTPTNETTARDAIVEGINNIIPNSTVYTDLEIDIRYFSSSQDTGSFDKVAFQDNQTWAFNYVTGNESFTNVNSSSYNIFNVWENSSLSYNQIVNQVEDYINSTII